jgi:hypothetical protein
MQAAAMRFSGRGEEFRCVNFTEGKQWVTGMDLPTRLSEVLADSSF